MKRPMLKSVGAVCLVFSVAACSFFSEQGSFEEKFNSLGRRTVGGTRDSSEAFDELKTFIAKYEKKNVSGWVCLEMSGSPDKLPCKGNDGLSYVLKIVKDVPEKHFYRDTITFSGTIEKIKVDLLGSRDVEVSNVTIDKVSK